MDVIPNSSDVENANEIEIPYDLFHFMNSSDFDIHKICRICLSNNNTDMHSIAPSEDSVKSQILPEMFSSITSLKIVSNDHLPSNICDQCRLTLESSWEFRTKCVKADSILKSLFQASFVTKEEPCDKFVSSEIPKEPCIETFKDVKEELAMDDVQYLEDFSDDEALSIVQNIQNIEKKQLLLGDEDSQAVDIELDLKKKLKSNVCSFCLKRFRKRTALKNHIKRRHSNASLPNSCSFCKETFSSEHDLELHLPLHEKGPVWTCAECQKEFNGRAALRRHVARHMTSKRWACEACGKAFAELYALRRHSRTHTGQPPPKRHACHLCDKRYSDASQLSTHMSRHTGARPCVCDECGKAFPSARLLNSHRLVHSDKKPYACDYCDKRFRHESTRNTHHRTHTGEKPYVCLVCGKTFIQNSNLTLHMRTHTGERPYKCDTCERKFSSGSTLKAHIRTHTGEKPYSCKTCGKKFARVDLRAHMRQHTGERPFECAVCRRKFATAARLREHHRLHTGEKPFDCSECTQKFPTKSHLMKHMKMHKQKKGNRHLFIVKYDDSQNSNNRLVVDKEIEAETEQKIDSENNDAMDTIYEDNLEVTEECVVPDDSDAKSELLVVDDTQNSFQNSALCLTTGDVNYDDMQYSNDMNLVTVNEGEVRMLEGSNVKMYQLDQSLVQIHSSAGQVTISKITSKMTANF